ncbi:MAG: hypothetical protein QOD52_2276 [Gaiellaceae bacterium]|nr:hypothetical protein [Gaiellaceae bacterium]
MNVRSIFRLFRVVLVVATLALAVCAATAQAWNSSGLGPGDSFGTTTCPTLSGTMFTQSGYCFYFPDGSTNTPATCDPAFCGAVTFLFPTAGTFTASITYPAPSGFNLLGLQLCHNGQALPDPTNCPQTMSPGGTPVDCTSDVTTNDNGTPTDLSDDTQTTTITCPILAGDSVNTYTLIVYPLGVQHCDVTAIGCLPDPTQGITGALSGNFSASVLTPGPANGKVSGGGEVGPNQHFSLHAVNDPSKWSHTHLRFAIGGDNAMRCSFKANDASFVNVQPNGTGKGSGGTATVTGSGTVTDSLKIKHDVTYQLTVTDGGKGGTDTFQLSAFGCDTNGLPTPVTHGNIVISTSGSDH